MKGKRWRVAAAVGIAACLLLIFALRQETPQEISYLDFWAMAEAGEIVSVAWSEGSDWQVVLRGGARAVTPNPRTENSKERLLALGIEVKEKSAALPDGVALGVLAAGVCLFFLAGRSRGAVGLKSLAAVQPEERVPRVTFDDVAVPPDVLRSMQDLAGFLKTPGRYAKYGARFPRGVLLYGPPGTGKTLLARALAGEAHAPFFAMSGADFVQVYVGVGASRVRELFRKARKAGGGVIFIDEIDAIGKKRDNANDEREQTLNALLTEMSGFSGEDGIIVLAATNRIDTLDPALLREGRFDRRIEVGLPDYRERLKILAVHARGKPLAAGVSLEELARQTVLFSGAQLETLLNEAAIRAARRSADAIAETDLEGAFCFLAVGDERIAAMSETEKRVTAYHEAGHAVVTHAMLPENRITRLTILPSSRGAAGYTMSVPPESLLHTRGQLTAMICAALGGRAAEEILLGRENVTTGAAGDLKRAREIAAAMAHDFCMGESGDALQDEKQFFCGAFDRTRQCLEENRRHLDALAAALLEKETLGEEEILNILA